MLIKDIKVPDIGDFDAIEVIEIAVAVGDSIEKEQTLITLESDKATMDIPSPEAGVVKEISVSNGDKLSKDSLILKLETDAASKPTEEKKEATVEKQQTVSNSDSDQHAQVVVLGAGPGGYTAAFRAADLGLKTILIERYESIGGVCLNVGCIPSKALLHVGKIISEVDELKEHGIELGSKMPDPKPVRNWTETVINKLTSGLKSMAKQRKVDIVQGTGKFTSVNSIEVDNNGETKTITFDHAIIAAGSQATKIPALPDDPRIMDSTDALLLEKIPKRMLVIGGGIIGLEMATVYASLGCKITIVEMLDSLIAGCDKDIVRPLQKRIKKLYENIYLKTAVTSVKALKSGLEVCFDGKDAPDKDKFDAVLVAVGRLPNGNKIGADKAGINVNERGFIPVDDQQRTNVPHIFAIGDIVGQPMLAHKATHEGKIAAEVIAGHKVGFDNRLIPSVAYTDPEIAWVGLSETEAKEAGIEYGKGVFPWAASGRSLSLGRDEGITKILFDKATKRILGAAIVGPNAGDLIAECTLAIEMGADAEDIGLTIHPHPTLSETVAMAAEVFEGTITDLYIPKK
ncbi:MAG: dihydrolipoyl dehydrogenase [Proteobacteria bacterium]|nr:dihydrolipoyl dehydrogenase [Pseudomonadota bacterium]NOG59694.1 dihydrolipoyl dehydrogenase [Pseudomonadota bacterium]